MTEIDQLMANIAAHNRSVYEYQLAEARRKRRAELVNSLADICTEMAMARASLSLHPSASVAAEAMADSYRWTAAAAMARVVEPGDLLRFLDEAKGGDDGRG